MPYGADDALSMPYGAEKMMCSSHVLFLLLDVNWTLKKILVDVK